MPGAESLPVMHHHRRQPIHRTSGGLCACSDGTVLAHVKFWTELHMRGDFPPVVPAAPSTNKTPQKSSFLNEKSSSTVVNPGFLRGSVNPTGGANPLFGIILAENCRKLKKKWTKKGRDRDVCPLPTTPIDPPLF